MNDELRDMTRAFEELAAKGLVEQVGERDGEPVWCLTSKVSQDLDQLVDEEAQGRYYDELHPFTPSLEERRWVATLDIWAQTNARKLWRAGLSAQPLDAIADFVGAAGKDGVTREELVAAGLAGNEVDAERYLRALAFGVDTINDPVDLDQP